LKSKEIILNYIVEMFPEKERNWVTGPFYPVIFNSWTEWVTHRPYTNSTWSKMKILIWNIKEESNIYNLQLIYAIPHGKLDNFWGVTITVVPEEESAIRKWLLEQKDASQ